MSSTKNTDDCDFNQSTRNLLQVNEKISSISLNQDNRSPRINSRSFNQDHITPKQKNNYKSCSVGKKRSSFQIDFILNKPKIKMSIDSIKTLRINNKKYRPIISFSYQSQICNLKTSYDKNIKSKYHECTQSLTSPKIQQQQFSILPICQIDLHRIKTNQKSIVDSSQTSKSKTTDGEINFLGNEFISRNKKEKLSLNDFENIKYIGLLFSYMEQTNKSNQNIEDFYQKINKTNKIVELVFIAKDVSDRKYFENYHTFPGLSLPDEKTFKKAKDLIRKFNLKSFPSLIVITNKGKILMKMNKKQLMTHGFEKLFNLIYFKNSEKIMTKPQIYLFKDFIDQFQITFLNKEIVSQHHLLFFSLIVYYKPSNDNLKRLKEEYILKQIYFNCNSTIWNLGLIVIKNKDNKYKFLNNLRNKKLFPIMEINCNSNHYGSNNLDCDGLIICNNKQQIISRIGFMEISQYQYKVFNYWYSQLNNSLICNPTSSPVSSLLGNSYMNEKGNLLSFFPMKEHLFIHFFSIKQENQLNEREIVNYLYSTLKNKMLFVHITIQHQNELSKLSNILPFSGLYITYSNYNLINNLVDRFNINLSLPFLPKIILATNNLQIIKQFSKRDIIEGINSFNNIINPSFFFNIETFKNVLNNSFRKDKIELLSNYNLICLYFGNSESIKSKAVTSKLIEAYNNINRNIKRIEIIYYPQNKTLRHLKSASKEVPFPCCDFDSNDIYTHYNKGKKELKLMILNRNGNIIIDNAIDSFVEKGEALFKELFEDYLEICYDTSENFQCSFLGDEFIDKKGNRVTRDHFSQNVLIGLYFTSARCPFSHRFNIQLKNLLNDTSENTIEIILNPIDNDRDLYYSLQKKMLCLIVPYEYKDTLIQRFQIFQSGVPSLFIFNSLGQLITINGMEEIDLLHLKAFENWKSVK